MSIITENEQAKKQEILTSDIEKRKVSEHNDLITSIAKMDKTPLKIFELAVSYIDTKNPPEDNIVYLSKTELFSFFDVTDSAKHTRFKEAIEKMQQTAYFEIKEVVGKGYNLKRIVPIPMVEWNSYNDKVKIRFDIDIMPYLIDLGGTFTQYGISDIMKLNSKYSIILYKWLRMSYNQFEYYSSNGGRRDDQLKSYCNPSISVSELRELTDTVNDYSRFDNFESWILKKTLDEINKQTHLIVSYEKIKKGRSIDSIQFHIEEKNKPSEDNSYKLEDKAYQEDKAQKEQAEDQLAIEAMKSPYTKLLIENLLLTPFELTDTSILAGLQKNVYPQYEKLKELRGIGGVKNHLSYVASKREDYSKRNISKYLKKAIEQYLGTLGDFK
ncbi:RepB family plasmid replication initiator protein [Lactococcus lactis]|uniref:RepB family plasmid replication initiator protein n=1 Tax=Lactococcus lactis TaxID=1358 RepID=UPI0019117C11|nr:RepB family plasmid replication initiator protein [Lactococcus lactis]WDA67507.1 RepB family plasmid replication initiator protein [Lactococcus lactis]WDA67534.1 RepB family plasmid replication initiator protein [Lactococcus lactis]